MPQHQRLDEGTAERRAVHSTTERCGAAGPRTRSRSQSAPHSQLQSTASRSESRWAHFCAKLRACESSLGTMWNMPGESEARRSSMREGAQLSPAAHRPAGVLSCRPLSGGVAAVRRIDVQRPTSHTTSASHPTPPPSNLVVATKGSRPCQQRAQHSNASHTTRLISARPPTSSDVSCAAPHCLSFLLSLSRLSSAAMRHSQLSMLRGPHSLVQR